MKSILLFIWQLPQNILGFLLSLTAKCKKTFVCNDGTVHTVYLTKLCPSGVSLGDFIILGYNFYYTFWDCSWMESDIKNTINHEHGHQFQSKKFGWFYLLIVGVPSFLRATWDALFHRKWEYKNRTQWYYSQFPENAADKFGGVVR